MKIVPANIFNSKCDCIVNTVNTVGVMGSGLALEFRLRVPRMYYEYMKKCESKEIKIGTYWCYRDYERINKTILNFPTKTTFAKPSKERYLYEGLDSFRNNYKKDKITSIAFPLLGTRNGKIPRDMSLFIMKLFLSDLPIYIEICLNEYPDRFTKFVLEKLFEMSVEEIVDEISISKYYINKLKSNLDKIHFLSEIVSNKIVPIDIAHRIYDYFISKDKGNKLPHMLPLTIYGY